MPVSSWGNPSLVHVAVCRHALHSGPVVVWLCTFSLRKLPLFNPEQSGSVSCPVCLAFPGPSFLSKTAKRDRLGSIFDPDTMQNAPMCAMLSFRVALNCSTILHFA